MVAMGIKEAEARPKCQVSQASVTSDMLVHSCKLAGNKMANWGYSTPENGSI